MNARCISVIAGPRRGARTYVAVWGAAVIALTALGGARALAAEKTLEVLVSKKVVVYPALSIASLIASEDEFKKKPIQSLKVPVLAGDLLVVNGKGPDGKGSFEFMYVVQGDERSPLVFSHSGPVGLLHGRPVFVDLTRPEGRAWLEKRSGKALGTLRWIRIAGDVETDPKLLKRFAGAGISVQVDSDINADRTSPLWLALKAAAPRGLMAKALGDVTLLEDLPDLTHLVMSGKRLPTEKVLRRLTCYVHAEHPDAALDSLDSLKAAQRLQHLYLGECKGVKDFSPLRRLTGLRRLAIGESEQLGDLSVLAALKELRSLVCHPGKKAEDLSPIGKLTKLEELMLASVPESVKDLTPLKKLKKLRVLVVDGKSFKGRKAEFDDLQKALPNTKIIGFCMGSLWIVVPMLAGAVGVAVSRRRRKAAARA